MTKSYTAGFTLVEMLSVIAITMIMGSLFYTTFIMNWQGLDDGLNQTELWTEADMIADDMTYYGRAGKQFDVSSDSKSVTIIYPDLAQNISYTITSTPTGGQLARVTASGETVLSYYVSYPNTSFTLDSLNTLVVNLQLQNTSMLGKLSSAPAITSFRILARDPTGVEGV